MEMSGDHQQPYRKRDDPKLGGDVKPARGPAGRHEGFAAEDREKRENGDEADQRSHLGAAHETADRRYRSRQGKRCRRILGWSFKGFGFHGTVPCVIARTCSDWCRLPSGTAWRRCLALGFTLGPDTPSEGR